MGFTSDITNQGQRAALIAFAVVTQACLEAEAPPPAGKSRQAAVFGYTSSCQPTPNLTSDPRSRLDQSFFTANPRFRAVGTIEFRTGGVWGGPACSATKVTPGHVLTAAHCPFSVNTNPSDVRFRPAAICTAGVAGCVPPTGTSNASISFRRIVRGTGGPFRSCTSRTECADSAAVPGQACLCPVQGVAPTNCAVGFCDYYEAGADFVILEIEPSSFTASALVPTWESIAAFELGVEPGTNTVAATSAGYSGDFLGATGFGSIDRNCQLLERVQESGFWFDGIRRSNCSWMSGQSGGPLLAYAGGAETKVVGITNGGPCVYASSYSTPNANLVTDTFAAYWSPWDARGITANLNADGRVHVYATDGARLNQIMLRYQYTTSQTTPHRYSFSSWADARSPAFVSPPNPTRMSSALYDQRQFVFAVGSDQRVYANWQTAPNANLNGWDWFFGSDSQTAGVIDIATDSTSPTQPDGRFYQYILNSSGTIHLRGKSGGWNGSWGAWQTLASGTSNTRIAASHTGPYPVVVAISPQAPFVSIAWGGSDGTSWVALQNFGGGSVLPSWMAPIDIKLGQTNDGRLVAYLLGTEASGAKKIWRRVKSTSSPGSAWNEWEEYRSSSPELNGATALGLLPPHGSRGDELLLVSDGRIFSSFWNANALPPTFEGWAPFYGPIRPW